MRIGNIFISAFLFLPLLAVAEEQWQAGVIPYGMGGAYSAVADDWLSLYYNPAGLAMVKKVEVQPLDVVLGTNSDVVGAASDLKALSGSGGLASELSKLAGKHVEAKGADFSQITLPYFAFGVSYQVNADFNLSNVSYPTTVMQYTKDTGVSVGGAVGFGKQNDLRIGVHLEYIHRDGSTQSVGLSQYLGSTSALVDLFNQQGDGYAGTLGLQYKLPIQSRIEVNTAFVWHDIGDTSFGNSSSKNRPSTDSQDLVAGLAIRFPIGGAQNRRALRRYGPKRSTSAFTIAYDYSELATPWSSRPFMMHSHIGANIDLPILSLQAGLYQSGISFGTGFDLGVFKVAASTYSQELGAYAGQSRDRRYLLSIGSAFGFGL